MIKLKFAKRAELKCSQESEYGRYRYRSVSLEETLSQCVCVRTRVCVMLSCNALEMSYNLIVICTSLELERKKSHLENRTKNNSPRIFSFPGCTTNYVAAKTVLGNLAYLNWNKMSKKKKRNKMSKMHKRKEVKCRSFLCYCFFQFFCCTLEGEEK